MLPNLFRIIINLKIIPISSSKLASQHTAAARSAVLQFFGADPEIYTVIWTSNASTAMRIVGEGYDWQPNSRLFIGHDTHSMDLT